MFDGDRTRVRSPFCIPFLRVKEEKNGLERENAGKYEKTNEKNNRIMG